MRRTPAALQGLTRHFNKFRMFFDPHVARFLYLDADTLMIAPILERPYRQADVYPSTTLDDLANPETRRRVGHVVFDVDALAAYDPGIVLPRVIKTFNSGHFFARSGIFDTGEVLRWVTFLHTAPVAKTIFKMYDQGLLNVLVNLAEQRGAITIGTDRFTINPRVTPREERPALTMARVLSKQYRGDDIVHYTTPSRHPLLRWNDYSDLLRAFYTRYYDHFPPQVRLRDEMNALPTTVYGVARLVRRHVLPQPWRLSLRRMKG